MDGTRIPLRKRGGAIVAHAIVDPEDSHLAQHRWYLHKCGYAVRAAPSSEGQSRIYMHREILGLRRGDKCQADHINRDKLDNRRENLRIATNALNHQNVNANRGSTSKYRGVSWDKRRQRWSANVKVRGRNHWLGSFRLEEDAAAAASSFRAEHMPFSADAAGVL